MPQVLIQAAIQVCFDVLPQEIIPALFGGYVTTLGWITSVNCVVALTACTQSAIFAPYGYANLVPSGALFVRQPTIAVTAVMTMVLWFSLAAATIGVAPIVVGEVAVA